MLACDALALPEDEAPSGGQTADMPTKHLRVQHCSRTWLSSSGRHALTETNRAEATTLNLEDLTTKRRMTLSLQALQVSGKVWTYFQDRLGRLVESFVAMPEGLLILASSGIIWHDLADV